MGDINHSDQQANEGELKELCNSVTLDKANTVCVALQYKSSQAMAVDVKGAPVIVITSDPRCYYDNSDIKSKIKSLFKISADTVSIEIEYYAVLLSAWVTYKIDCKPETCKPGTFYWAFLKTLAGNGRIEVAFAGESRTDEGMPRRIAKCGFFTRSKIKAFLKRNKK